TSMPDSRARPPGELKPVRSAARFFPFGLGGQIATAPRRVTAGVGPGDTGDRLPRIARDAPRLGNTALLVAHGLAIIRVLFGGHLVDVHIERIEGRYVLGSRFGTCVVFPQSADSFRHQCHDRAVSFTANAQRQTFTAVARTVDGAEPFLQLE